MLLRIYPLLKTSYGYGPSDIELARVILDGDKFEIESIDGAVKEKINSILRERIYIREPAAEGESLFAHRYRSVVFGDPAFIPEIMRRLRTYNLWAVME